MLISVLKIVGNTAADGPGLRTSVYLAGCSHHCPGCHNPQSWDIDNGMWMEVDDLIRQIDSYENSKVTLTGGDPFYQGEVTYELVRKLKERGYNVWIYTGYTLEGLRKDEWDLPSHYILDMIDGLVDGPFKQGERDISLRFRGSQNQKIYTRDSQGNLMENLELES